MKIKFVIYTCLLAVFIISCKDSNKSPQKPKTTGNLKISKSKPQAGDDIVIRYQSENSNFLGDEFAAAYYIVVDDAIYAEDLEMKGDNDVKKANLHIPDSATAIGFNFKNGEDYDTNNNQGYAFALYDNGELIPGALASKANYHRQMDTRSGIEKSQTDSILKWMKTDIEQHPEIEDQWAKTYAQLLLKQQYVKGEEYIKERLAPYADQNALSEKDYNAAIDFYAMLRKEGKQDSVIKVAAAEYPESKIAQRAFVNRFGKAESTDEKKEIFDQYQDSIDKAGQYKDMMLNGMIQLAQKDDDFDKAEKYLEQLSDKFQIAFTYNSLALSLLKKDEKLDDAVRFAKKAVGIFSVDNLDKPDLMTESEFKKTVDGNAHYLRDTYARALYKNGNLAKALKEQKKAVGMGDIPDLNEHYIQYLIENKDFKEAEDKASKFIAEGNTTEELKSFFKKAYKENHDSVEGYDDKLTALEEKAFEKTQKEIESDMMNKEVPDLHLTDAEGNRLQLDDLKGKTVVLDFWATWCGPCIQSFPGMERAMKHFKDNDKVEFYYVNTFQREDKEERHKKVADFIESNDYPFDILYDENDHNTFKTASGFGITGIPTKIIIGPDGKWNFTKVGYGGNNDKLLDEIKVMVELTQP